MAANNTVSIIGATGLIGSRLLSLLKDDNDFDNIRLIVRRPLSIIHQKAEVRVIDFENDTALEDAIAGSMVIFSAIGTTQSKVKGDKTAYRKIDFDIPVHAAQFGSNTGCSKFLFVSSVGASSRSSNFYLNLKGDVEDAVKQTGIAYIGAFRPSMLLGYRQESRPMEKIMQPITKAISFLLPSKYKPIAADKVARAMIAAAKSSATGFHIYHYNEINELAEQ